MIIISELVKLGYRGLGGFIAVVLMFSFSVTALALFLSGAFMIFGAIYVFIDPSLLDSVSFYVFNTRITEAATASLILIVVTIILFAIGSFFIGLVFLIAKSALKIDQELGKIVDRTVPSLEGRQKMDRVSQLERLGALRNQGVLTEEEFTKEKARILQENR